MCKSAKTRSSLKRPHPKGNFPCSSCEQSFQNQPSLHRHRARVHSAEYKCVGCKTVIAPGTTVRKHMKMHGFQKIFTCGCCHWSFATKKLLSDHEAVLRNNGNVHDVPAIAISIHTPGSLKILRDKQISVSESESSIFDQLSALSRQQPAASGPGFEKAQGSS